LGIIYYKEPELENPQMLACWPGMGNIGTIAAEQLTRQSGVEEAGEIEPWDFFYPRKVTIRSGVLTQMEFPSSKFYFKKLGKSDLIVFKGDEQPTEDRSTYAGGKKALQMANLVLDAAEKFGCRRIYTSCAAISQTHHSLKSKVWASSSRKDLNKEMQNQENTILMSEAEGRRRYSSIPGLNGILLGLARQRGMDAVCLMGEIPDYLVQVQLPYPRASKAVLEVLSGLLETEIDYSQLDEMIARVDALIEEVYQQFPPELKEKVEQRKSLSQARAETITEQDEKWFKEHIDELFKKGNSGGK
jgi:proteasome assembly chaperone (PAC2) family protein